MYELNNKHTYSLPFIQEAKERKKRKQEKKI